MESSADLRSRSGFGEVVHGTNRIPACISGCAKPMNRVQEARDGD